MENNKGKKIFGGLIWSFGERITAQLVTFLVTIILARILDPEEYGIVSLLLVFIALANVFVSNGFGESLIQKKDTEDQDFSTIFWCAFLFSLIIYGILFVFAPVISEFYGNNRLSLMIRIISLKLPISSLSTIQHAFVSKKLQFRKFFFSTLAGTIISGIVGVILAYHGAGAWAIIWQYLINSTIDTIVLLFTIEWRPRFVFDKHRAKVLLSFGWKMTFSAFINSLYGEIRTLIIGKLYTTEELAQYKRGIQFPQLFITNINTAVSSVLFPALSLVNDDIAEIKRLTRKSMSVTAYLIFPLMIGLAVVAKPLVTVLLTDKWLPCVPFLQLACITQAVQPIQTANCQAIKSVGRSDIYLKMEIVKKTFGIIILLLAMRHGVFAIAVADVFAVLFSVIVSMIPNVSLIHYSIREQLFDLLHSFVISFVMGCTVYPVQFLPFPSYCILFLQIILGIITYVLLSKFTHCNAYIYLIGVLQSMIQKGKRQ